MEIVQVQDLVGIEPLYTHQVAFIINQHYESYVKQCKLMWNKPNKHVAKKLKKIIKGARKWIGQNDKE
jgi:hypothetical protein